MNNIIIGTSNYENALEGNLVSITGDGGRAWNFTGNAYKKLAPRLVTYTPYSEALAKLNELKKDINMYQEYLRFRNQIENEYIESYYLTRLKDLDIEELFSILKHKYGNEIILLCHEPVDEFCHRRVLADYIEIVTGTYIPEVIAKDGKIKKENPIRYKERLRKIINKYEK